MGFASAERSGALAVDESRRRSDLALEEALTEGDKLSDSSRLLSVTAARFGGFFGAGIATLAPRWPDPTFGAGVATFLAIASFSFCDLGDGATSLGFRISPESGFAGAALLAEMGSAKGSRGRTKYCGEALTGSAAIFALALTERFTGFIGRPALASMFGAREAFDCTSITRR